MSPQTNRTLTVGAGAGLTARLRILISGLALAEGAAIATLMVPFLLAAIMFSYFGLQRRAWQQGGDK